MPQLEESTDKAIDFKSCSRRSLLAGALGAFLVFWLPEPASADDNAFIWAAGIEDTFIPDTKSGMRALEEYELTQHYMQWKQDLDKAAELGISVLRWGIPWYRVEPQRGKFDWSWTDQVLDYMIDELHIDPMLDLIHYGTPAWLDRGFLNPDYPQYAAEYAAEVVTRYGARLKYVTPTNEPCVGADFACRRGEWPPYEKSESAYLRAIVSIARGIQTVSTEVAKCPGIKLVAVEALRQYLPCAEGQTPPGLLKDLLAWDLSRGVVDGGHPLYGDLIAHGITEELLAELRQHAVHQDILGVNFYPWSVQRSAGDHSNAGASGSALKALLQQVYRYGQTPLMVTETSSRGTLERKQRWMKDTIEAVRQARTENIPVVGYTWFPILAMIEWKSRTDDKALRDSIIQLWLWNGSFDRDDVMHRVSTPMVAVYKQFIKNGRL